MKLDEFVRDTIVQLVQGVKEAQTAVDETGAKVNPGEHEGSARQQYLNKNRRLDLIPISNVHFEVVLTTIEEKDKKEGIGVFLASIGLGAQTSQAQSTNSLSKISFDVPIVFPQHPDK
jgi:hypothetical protein